MQDVLDGEDDAVPQLLLDPVGVLLVHEEPRQTPFAHRRRDRSGVAVGARGLDRRGVEIRGEHLEVEVLAAVLDRLEHHHRNGVGLLAGGAAGHPDPQPVVPGPVGQQRRQPRPSQGLEGLRIPEEGADPDQPVAPERVDLPLVALQIAHVVGEMVDGVDAHPPLDPTQEGVPLVRREVVTPAHADQREDALQVVGRGAGRLRLAPHPTEGAGVGDKTRGHLGDGEREVGGPGRDGTGRHAVELRRVGGLHQTQARRGVDGGQAERPVGARAGQDDPDRPVALIPGEALEERIHGPGSVAGLPRRLDREHTAAHRHRVTPGHQVDAVRQDLLLALELAHRHGGGLRQDLR